MSLRPGAVVVPEKVPVQWYNNNQIQPPYHQMDEREGFIMWLRGEFAAANAIIDALCHHLRGVGDPGEYDGVIGSIQQRRCNWNPILHMQQYFSVAEVVYSLQQVSWRRQQQQQQKVVGVEGTGRTGGGAKDFTGGGRGQRRGVEVHSLGGEVNGKDLNNGYAKSTSNANEKSEGGNKAMVDVKEQKKGSFHVDGSEIVREEKSNLQASLRTFVATEICEGKPVNIAEGMKLYENLFDDSEISKLTTLVNDLRIVGRRGHLKGAFATLKRPMRGHGREIIQLGVPIADAHPDDEAPIGASKDLKTEPIPELLQDIIERLLAEKVVGSKPDSTIIDFYNEGDYSQPHIWPQSFGRPVCVLFLTECEMSFGKLISIEHPGDYRGALQLSLSPGSMLLLQGRSADFARHAISSVRKQRILITLVKSQPKIINANDVHCFPLTPAPTSNWAPPPSRSASHIRPVTAKHFGPSPIPPPVVLAPPTVRPQLPPPNNGVQPIFVPTPVTPSIPFPALVSLPSASAGWPAGQPRHHPPPPRFPVPGTGFFLPSQGSGNSSNQSVPTESMKIETRAAGSEEDDAKKPNDGRTLQESDVEVAEQERKGSTEGGSASTKEVTGT